MIIGIGTDIVHIPRIAALITRRGFSKLASRILSPQENLTWQSLPEQNRVQFLAVRWGIKEAAYKAIYPHARPTWKDFTYQGIGANKEKPMLLYHLKLPKIDHLHVSVSHDGEYVLATVIAEKNLVPTGHG